MSAAKVRIQYADGRVQERQLPPGTYRIGRDAGDLVLGDPNVSGQHAQLTIQPEAVTVADMGSTNGTYDASGARLSAPRPLSENEWVRMGNTSITLLAGLPAAGAARAPNQAAAPSPAAGPAPVHPGQAPSPMHAPQQQGAPPQGYGPQGYAPQPQAAPHAPQGYPPQPHQPQPPHGHPQPPPGHPPQQPAAVQAPMQAAPAQGAAYGSPPAGGSLQASPQSPMPAAANDAAAAGGSGGAYSHPDQPIRHSYPLAQQGFGVGAAAGLLMKTAPFLGARLAVLVGASIVGLVYWVIVVLGFVFLGQRSVVVGYGWLIATLGVAGWLWHAVIRYFLYLLKAGHIAVLTDLVTRGEVGNGSEGMFTYGKRVVKDRFGQVNVLFGIDLLVDGVVRAFNRTLDWVGDLIPVPGLDSVMGFVRGVLRASTTYIDETIFSYNLARGDENVFRSSKDGLIYYAQNSKEILKTGVWVVILEKVLSFIVFIVLFLPALAIAYLLPASWGIWLPITAVVAGLLFAADVQRAVLRPLFLTMIMLKFHSVVQQQPINLEWDQRLEGVSGKFRELKEKAIGPQGQASPQPQALPAE